MNFFNKTLFAITLTMAIPLTVQANWFSNLSNNIMGKKKTIATGITLGGTLSYAAVKLANQLYKGLPTQAKLEEMLNDVPENIFNKAVEGFKNLEKERKTLQKLGAIGALGLTGGLIYLAHRFNLFGEK